ncbi:hypothetical protein [Hyalangium gracile]|uniref:hypothetical protein n=1 Tax=Hyalangium gracile TaxID=394092 RepID=UPI001CCC58CD|nr:hypothetical protein [Hyalangium gracile]
MAWSYAWMFRRAVQFPEQDSPQVFDVVDGVYMGGARIVWAFVVDAPHRGQLGLARSLVEMLAHVEWSGHGGDLLGVLDRLKVAISNDHYGAKTGRAGGTFGGVSLAGLALCGDMSLVAFRRGRFRVSIDGREVLPEETVLRENEQLRQMPERYQSAVQFPSRWLPEHPMKQDDMVFPSTGVVEVVHDARFGFADEGKPRVLIACRKTGSG